MKNNEWEQIAKDYDLSYAGMYDLELINALPDEEKKKNSSKIITSTRIIREKAENIIPLLKQNKVSNLDIRRFLEIMERIEVLAHDDGVDDAYKKMDI